jgi:hypothetical protein
LTTNELAVSSRQRTVPHFLFRQGIFYQNQHDSRPQQHYFSVYLRLKIIEVIEAESQAVLNTVTEHDYQDPFKMAEALGTVHTRGRGLLGGWFCVWL